MATAITIVSLNPIRTDPVLPATTETVDVYVYDSITTNLWLWTVRESSPGVPIPVSTPLATIQANLDANAAALLAACRNDTPVATGTPALQLQWIAAHLVWRKPFLNALWTLDNGILTIPSLTLANYQAIFPPVATILTTLPTPFQTHLANERTAQSVSGAPTTLAQCVTLDNLLHIWLNSRLNMANAARDTAWWLANGS